MSPHIFLVAGEESGDRLGAALIAAIKQRTNGQVHFSGVGSAHMAAEGVPSLFPLGDLAIIGFAAIPKSLPKILRRIREAADAVVSANPDALVIIDSPEFTHRVAKRVRAKLPEIPIVDYVCPSVWAWRPAEVVVPSVSRLAHTVRAAAASWRVPARVITDAEEKAEAFRSARAALSKSGTSTLELALAGVPMIAAYKVSLIEEIAGRLLLNVPSVILANLVLGENVVPEFLQRDCTPARLADTLLPLLSDTPERQRQMQAFARLDTIMQVGEGNPSDRGAAIVLDIAHQRHVKEREIPTMLQPSV